jgi:hypothetical protein
VAENGVLVNSSVSKSANKPARPTSRPAKPLRGVSAGIISTFSRYDLSNPPQIHSADVIVDLRFGIFL